MEKQLFETFIKKYNLSGLVEDVRLNSNGTDLSCVAMTSDKKMFVNVELLNNTFFKDKEVGILGSTKIKKMLACFSENINISCYVDEQDDSYVKKLIFEDSTTLSEFICANPAGMSNVPKLKTIPEFNAEIVLTTEFRNSFQKACSALGDNAKNFTLLMSKKNQRLELVLGYKENNMSDRIAIACPTTEGKGVLQEQLTFNTKHLKEIISANSDIDNIIFGVSDKGLGSVSFKTNNYKCDYYLVKVDIEE